MNSLDIHGMRFEEAMEAIEKFIDSSFYASPGTYIEIITGFGVIRPEAIALIENSSLIKSYKNNGGSFVVELED